VIEAHPAGGAAASKGYVVTIAGIDLMATAKATVKKFIDSDLQGMAAEIVYHLLFSIVPLLIFLTSLSGMIGRRIGTGHVINEVTGWLRTDANLPSSTVDVVLTPIEQVLENQTGGLLSIGAVLALWGGKNAFTALMKGLNVAYGVEETRPWWKTWGIAIGLTIALGLAATAASVFFVASTAAGEQVASTLNVTDTWATVWEWARLPLIAVLLCIIVSFLYWVGPDRHKRYEVITIGSIFTVVLWAAATLGLGLYFQYMGGYVVAYGVLGGLLGFLFWLFLMSLILLFGGQLNSVLNQQRQAVAQAEVATRVDQHRLAEPGFIGPPRLVPITSSISDEVRGTRDLLPSAEDAARRDQIARTGPDRRRGWQKAARLLGASALAAASAVVLGARGRG
jgi:membrane protein